MNSEKPAPWAKKLITTAAAPKP